MPKISKIRPAVATAESKKKLGDAVESLLSGIGITPERYVEAKKLFGLPPRMTIKRVITAPLFRSR